MHLRPGYAVFDVCYGPGSDTIALAELVGPTGREVGVDTDAAMIVEAEQRAEQAVADGAPISRGLRLTLETAAFDACQSERLFQHLHTAGLP